MKHSSHILTYIAHIYVNIYDIFMAYVHYSTYMCHIWLLRMGAWLITTSDHIGPHGTASGHFGPHGITWDYHTGLSEIIRSNLFKHNLIVTDSNNKWHVGWAWLNDKLFSSF